MSLPDLIEIFPPGGQVRADVTVPGSKSITNRVLVLGALADGDAVLQGALWSEDSEVMVECLRRLGFELEATADPSESSNRTIRIRGEGGRIPRAGTEAQPLELFVGNAGTAARFLAALVCLGEGGYRLSGIPRMHERPQAALFDALRQLGYRVECPNNRLPAVIFGAGPRPGACRVDIGESSQFASALLLSAKAGGWSVQVEGENAEESPYVAMTTKLIETFGAGRSSPGAFQIEPDASSGSYFWAAGWLLERAGGGMPANSVSVRNWPVSGWQIDAAFPRFSRLPARVSRQTDLGDSILTAMILAPFGDQPVTFADLGRLRLQECERVQAMRVELTKCGARVVEAGETLTIFPSTLRGAEVETYDDHRMAMCFSTLGLRVPGMRIRNPGCVKKTFPNFYLKLAQPAPEGIGAGIRDARTGRRLALGELSAG